MRIFLAGVMQGSHVGLELHEQEYRARIRDALSQHLPEAEVYDPFAEHGTSLEYDATRGREVFFEHNELCAQVDVVVAFVPIASMGTAIEMWQAHRAGRAVITISPLKHNWAVKFLSDLIFASLEEFEAALADGSVARLVGKRSPNAK